MSERRGGENHQYRVVTPQQLQSGWLELKGVIAERRSYHVIRRLPDGNYVVAEPVLKVNVADAGFTANVIEGEHH